MSATGRATQVLHMITYSLRNKFDLDRRRSKCREESWCILEETLGSQELEDDLRDEEEVEEGTEAGDVSI